ncbi:MAG: hypothetical protein QE280_14815 [Caulobacter sp.]|nr:hypothetical protein [Caulobacter sp.]
MKTLLIATVALMSVAVVSAANAQPVDRLSDAQFVKLARCKGLAKSPALGAVETAGFDAAIKANKRGRADFIVEKAMTAQDKALSEANRADEARKAELIAERSGACQVFAG